MAALRRNLCANVITYPERVAPLAATTLIRQVETSLRELRTTGLGDRVQVVPLQQLSVRINAGDRSIGIGKSSDFPDLVHLRSAFSIQSPIMGLVHAVLFPSFLPMLTAKVVQARPYDILIATSRAARTAVQTLLDQACEDLSAAFSGIQIRRPRVEHVPLGIEDAFCDPLDKQSARKVLGVPPDALVLLYVGRFSDEYKANLTPLLSAFAELASDIPRLRLILAGSTAQSRSDLLFDLRPLGSLEERVTLIENFPRTLKKAIYSAADIFTSPVDNIQESFGLSLLEAMAASLPIVASDWSGYRDLVVHGQTGFLVETWIDSSIWPGAELLASSTPPPVTEGYIARSTVINVEQFTYFLRLLLENEDLRVRLGSAGRVRVLTHYLWSSVIDEYAALWEDQWQVYMATADCSRAKPRLRRAFEGYATAPVNPHAMIVQASQRALDSFRRTFPADKIGTDVLSSCVEAPICLSALCQRGDRVQTALRLLKTGYLRVVLEIQKSVNTSR